MNIIIKDDDKKEKRMKKLVTYILVFFAIMSIAQGSVLHGKKVYAQELRKSCGFSGEVMGKKYTRAQWKAFYQNKTLAKLLQKECPRSKLIVKRRDLRSLAAFFVMFAKDSGNKASCGG
jgi:hypothetical protein